MKKITGIGYNVAPKNQWWWKPIEKKTSDTPLKKKKKPVTQWSQQEFLNFSGKLFFQPSSFLIYYSKAIICMLKFLFHHFHFFNNTNVDS